MTHEQVSTGECMVKLFVGDTVVVTAYAAETKLAEVKKVGRAYFSVTGDPAQFNLTSYVAQEPCAYGLRAEPLELYISQRLDQIMFARVTALQRRSFAQNVKVILGEESKVRQQIIDELEALRSDT